MKSYGVTIQMKATEQYLPVVSSIILVQGVSCALFCCLKLMKWTWNEINATDQYVSVVLFSDVLILRQKLNTTVISAQCRNFEGISYIFCILDGEFSWVTSFTPCYSVLFVKWNLFLFTLLSATNLNCVCRRIFKPLKTRKICCLL